MSTSFPQDFSDLLNLGEYLEVTTAVAAATSQTLNSLVGRRFFYNATTEEIFLLAGNGYQRVANLGLVNAATSELTHKRGDTFLANCTYTASDLTPISLAGVTVRSQIRTFTGVLVSELAVTIEDQLTLPGKFRLRAEASNTETWPEEILRWDIQYTDSSTVQTSDTVLIKVVSRVTTNIVPVLPNFAFNFSPSGDSLIFSPSGETLEFV